MKSFNELLPSEKLYYINIAQSLYKDTFVRDPLLPKIMKEYIPALEDEIFIVRQAQIIYNMINSLTN